MPFEARWISLPIPSSMPMLRELLGLGALLEDYSDSGDTVLHVAIVKGDTLMVKFLIERVILKSLLVPRRDCGSQNLLLFSPAAYTVGMDDPLVPLDDMHMLMNRTMMLYDTARTDIAISTSMFSGPYVVIGQ